MKSDLTTSVVVFIVGTIIAYFAGSMVFSAPSSVSIETLKADASYTFPDPDEEIFNFRAINPTVEAWIGECTNYDNEGNCLDNQTENQENPEETPEEEPEEENEEETEEEPEEETPAETPEENENGETD